MSNILPRLPIELFNESVQLPSTNRFEAVVQLNNRLTPGLLIDRTLPVTVTWSGGNPQTELAVITGFKTVTSLGGGTQGVTATTWFVCTAPVDAGSLMVPADVLLAMPTGKPTADPSGARTFVSWIPGANLNDLTLERSSLAVGIARQPAQSRFSAPGISFGRLLYILTTRRLDLNYR